jgi:hypothetical protein
VILMATAVQISQPKHWGGRATDWLFGHGPMRRLTIVHCLHSAAETFFTISMAGSIFFNVSADAARPRVLLFLVITLAPFLVMAPLVGPVIDRIRGGIGGVVVATFVARVVLVLLLAQQLRTLALFPLAFGVLVVAKTYTVGRNALTPLLAESDDDLVNANSRLSRTASIAGTLAGAVAVALFTISSGAWTLRAAAVLYVLGAAAAWMLRTVLPAAEAARRTDIVELLRVDISGAVWDMMALRAAVGYAMFHFAFSLRQGNESPWLLGAVIGANSVGGFLGTVVSPAIRARMPEQKMFTWSLLGAAGAMVACGLGYTSVTLIGAVLVLGLAASVGRRALDSTIQQHAPHAKRGRVYASLETRLELAWVAAGCVAVASRLSTWVGVLAVAGFLVVMAAEHVRRHRLIDLLEPAQTVSLTERLLLRAETLTGLDHHDEAIVVALSAVEVAGLALDDPKLRWARQLVDEQADHETLQKAARTAIERARTLIAGAARITNNPAIAPD